MDHEIKKYLKKAVLSGKRKRQDSQTEEIHGKQKKGDSQVQDSEEKMSMQLDNDDGSAGDKNE